MSAVIEPVTRFREDLKSRPGFMYLPAKNAPLGNDDTQLRHTQYSFAGHLPAYCNEVIQCYCGERANKNSVSTSYLPKASLPPFVFYWGCNDQKNGCHFCIPCNSDGMLFGLLDAKCRFDMDSSSSITTSAEVPFHFGLCSEHLQPALQSRSMSYHVQTSRFHVVLRKEPSEKEFVLDFPKQYISPLSCYICPYAFMSECEHFYLVLRRYDTSECGEIDSFLVDLESYSSFINEFYSPVAF